VQLRRAAYAGALWTAGGTVAVAVLQLSQLAVLAHLLEPGDFGLMALVAVVLGFVQAYADMGMSGAIVYREDVTREQLSTLLWLNLFAGAGMLVLVLLCSPLLAGIYGEPQLDGLVSLAAFSLLIAPASQQFFVLLQRQLRFKAMAVIDVSATLGGAATSIALAYGGHGVRSLVWGLLVNSALRSLILGAVCFRDWRPLLRFRRADLAGYTRFGIYQIGERTANFLGGNLDKLLIGALLGTHALGIYGVASQFVMKPIQLVNPILTRVAFPLFARIQDDDARLRSGFLDAIRILATVLFPCYVGMLVLAKSFTLAIVGAQWLSMVPTLQILCVLAMFYCLGNPLGSLLLAKGRVDLGLYLNVWRTTLFAIAIPVGAKWGIEGVASALVITVACLVFPVSFRIRWWLVEMRAFEYFKAFGLPLLAAVLMSAAMLGARLLGAQLRNPLADLAVLSVFGGLVYLVVTLALERRFMGRLRDVLR
jgi:lipopolysaccharide exporter